MAAVGLVALAACSSSAANAPATTLAATVPTVAPITDDRVLRIGVLLPKSGEGASIGESELAAVQVAVDQATAAGGVNGQPVELVVRDEGADAVAASVSLQDLLDNKVDVIIGPASSTNAIALAPALVQADVAACSPSASALAMDDFPDNHLFFRTIPSDSLQAEAMAKVIEQTGETTASIAYVDDGYGRPFEAALESALKRRSISVGAAVGFAVDDSEFNTEAVRVARSGTGAIALIGDPDAGSRVLAALAQATAGDPRDIVVNDALREPWSISLLNSVKPAARERIVGVSPYVLTDNAELMQAIATTDVNATGLFATQAYDCANLFMIAAEQTGSTQADTLANVVPGISSGGSVCTTFAECVALIGKGRNIDYDGPSGRLALGESGDPSSGVFDEFSFDETGRDVSKRQLDVSAR
ncbi:MAG: putative transporter substrate-binding protein [Ilumatobacteraceae bacterium]|nr:putative transporter substrate-binding protein [Ilumatobacteraceae bacterium]MCU1387470.1 putative transporter substrate-binding protein [Ilumatobacteraceae bacterium]